MINTMEIWEKVIRYAARSNESILELAQLLKEADQAKQILRDKGYGFTGTSLLETVKLVPDTND